MPAPSAPSETPSTEAEFSDRLVRLIRGAHANGVEVGGAWADRNPDPDIPDWGVEIYEVARPDDRSDRGPSPGTDADGAR
jgi:hypothetical protein